MKIYLKLLGILSLISVESIAYAQSLPATENYIQTRVYIDSVKTSSATAKQFHTVQYFDGLGRPKQVVNVKASPLGRDVVTHIEYDGFGRQVKDYLPVPQANTLNGAIVPNPLSNATNAAIYGQEKIYAEKTLENSPLDRLLEQKQVGTAWNTKPVKFQYDANINEDYVRKYETTTTWHSTGKMTVTTVKLLQYFLPNSLYKNTVIDEDGNKTIEFKNGQGQVILVRKVLNATENADTYYVYNEYNQLAFVIPPLASAPTVVPATVENLYYQYRYDGKGRLVEKKVPGKGWEYLVYNKADRLIMTQDANLKEKGQWLFTKYDKFGRVVYTGISNNSSSRQVLQTNVNTNGNLHESRSTTAVFTLNGMQVYYTKSASPTGMVQLLSVNYYDTYPPGSPATTNVFNQKILTDNPGSKFTTKGLPLASYVKNIEDDNWTRNFTWYDTKGRVMGTRSNNHLGGYTVVNHQLDFAGTPLRTSTYHRRLANDPEKTIHEYFTYDNQKRLVMHRHKVGANPLEILAQNKYNELSQLESKKVGGVVTTVPLQQIDYKYNIRGWMTQINDPANLGTDLFGYQINYNQVQGLQTPDASDPALKVLPRYNGNIAEVSWKTATAANEPLRRYGYVYDGLNRLLAGFYQKSTNPSAKEYFEKMSYDLNGNIINLKRSANVYSGTTASLIDHLTYTYNGNRLNTITDSTEDFAGYPGGGGSISYDNNGNMTSHPDKVINEIRYNFLNLPNSIKIVNGRFRQTSDYLYRADGIKIRKSFLDGSIQGDQTDYLDGFQYKNGVLQFIPSAEGYYDFINNSYIYNYTDHLGNVRVGYKKGTSGTEIIEENNYYPFGLKHEGYNGLTGNSSYQYKYNGKELQETGMYDYGARMYMPDLGRWGVQDPNQESYTNHSSYNYVGNNPIMRIDPDGRDWYYTGDGQYLYNKDLNKDNSSQFFKDNNIEGAKYAFASNTMGTMNYAADGYIYDDSASGGGKPIENGRLNNIEGVTITKTNWMNSPLARFLVPDRFGVTQSGSVGGGAEIGTSMGLEVITRGKDAGVYFDPGNTLSLGLAFGEGGVGSLSFFSSTFTGKVSDMSLNSVVGTEAYVNGSLAAIAGVTGSVAVSFDPNPNNGPVSGRWVTRSVGVSVGAKASVGAGVTLSNTRVGVGFDGKIRVADYTGAVTGKGSY